MIYFYETSENNLSSPYALLELFDENFAAFNSDYAQALECLKSTISELNSLLALDDESFNQQVNESLNRAMQISEFVSSVAARETSANKMMHSIAEALDIDANISSEEIAKEVSKSLGINLASADAKEKLNQAISANPKLAKAKSDAAVIAADDAKASAASEDMKQKASMAAKIASTSAKLNTANEAEKDAIKAELDGLKEQAKDEAAKADAAKADAAGGGAVGSGASASKEEVKLLSKYQIDADYIYKIGTDDDDIALALNGPNDDILNAKLSELNGAKLNGLIINVANDEISLKNSAEKIVAKLSDASVKEFAASLIDASNQTKFIEIAGNKILDAKSMQIGEHIVKFDDEVDFSYLIELSANEDAELAKLIKAGAISIDNLSIKGGVLDNKVVGLKANLKLSDIKPLLGKDALTWGDVKTLLDPAYKVVYVNNAALIANGAEFKEGNEAILDAKPLSEFSATNLAGVVPNSEVLAINSKVKASAAQSGTKSIEAIVDANTQLRDLMDNSAENKEYLRDAFSENANKAYELLKINIGSKSIEIGDDENDTYLKIANGFKIYLSDDTGVNSLLNATTVGDLKALKAYNFESGFYKLKDSVELSKIPADLDAISLADAKELIDIRFINTNPNVKLSAEATYGDTKKHLETFKDLKDAHVDTYYGFKIDANSASKFGIKFGLSDNVNMFKLLGSQDIKELKANGVTSINDVAIDNAKSVGVFNSFIAQEFSDDVALRDIHSNIADQTLGKLGYLSLVSATNLEGERKEYIGLNSFEFKTTATFGELKALLAALKGTNKAASIEALKAITNEVNPKAIDASATDIKAALNEAGKYYLFNSDGTYAGLLEKEDFMHEGKHIEQYLYTPIGGIKLSLRANNEPTQDDNSPTINLDALPTKDTKLSELGANYAFLPDISYSENTNTNATLADLVGSEFKDLKALNEFKMVDYVDDQRVDLGTVKYNAANDDFTFTPNKELDLFKTGGKFAELTSLNLANANGYALVDSFKEDRVINLKIKSAELGDVNIFESEGALHVMALKAPMHFKLPTMSLSEVLKSSMNDLLAKASEADLGQFKLIAKDTTFALENIEQNIHIRGAHKASATAADWINLANDITVANLSAVADNVKVTSANGEISIDKFANEADLDDVLNLNLSESKSGSFEIKSHHIELNASNTYELGVKMDSFKGNIDIKNFGADDKLVLHFSHLDNVFYDLAQSGFKAHWAASEYSSKKLQKHSALAKDGAVFAHEYTSDDGDVIKVVGLNTSAVGDEEFINIKGIANAHYELSGNDLIITSGQ